MIGDIWWREKERKREDGLLPIVDAAESGRERDAPWKGKGKGKGKGEGKGEGERPGLRNPSQGFCWRRLCRWPRQRGGRFLLRRVLAAGAQGGHQQFQFRVYRLREWREGAQPRLQGSPPQPEPLDCRQEVQQGCVAGSQAVRRRGFRRWQAAPP